MDFALDDVDTDRLGSGYNNPKPGRYHGQVTDVVEKNEKGQMTADIEVLTGTLPNQEGKNQRIFFDLEGKNPEHTMMCKKKILSFAIATGLTSETELKSAKESGRRISLDWALAKGRQVCFEVEANDKTKSGTSADPFKIWHMDSPKANGIPRNEGAAATAGDAATDPFGDVF